MSHGTNHETVVCAGCGLPVGPGAGVGRRARYHGPACRQRARRARLAATPDRSALLDQVGRAEAVLAVLRRDLLAGRAPDVEAAAVELAAVAGRLRTRAVGSSAAPVTVAEPGATTGDATEPRHETELGAVLTSLLDNGVDVWTVERVAVRKQPRRRRWTVWHDQPGVGEVSLGGLYADPAGGGWGARDNGDRLVPGGPWGTQRDALTELLGHLQGLGAVRVDPSPAAVAAAATDDVTKSVTPRIPADFDPDAVRITRPGNHDMTGEWQVVLDLAGGPPVTLGTLCPTWTTGGTKRWTARDHMLSQVRGGPWTTRKDAVTGLLMAQRTATRNAAAQRGRRKQGARR